MLIFFMYDLTTNKRGHKEVIPMLWLISSLFVSPRGEKKVRGEKKELFDAVGAASEEMVAIGLEFVSVGGTVATIDPVRKERKK